MYHRISDILGFFKDLSHVPPEMLERKCTIGTNVHEAIHHFCKESTSPCLTSEEDPYFQSFLKWRFLETGTPLHLETRYYDDERMITGQVDMILEKNGCRYLVDFKTSAKADQIFWPIQGGFYYQLVKPIEKLKPEVIFVQLKKNKKPTCYSYTITDELLAVCDAMCQVYKYLNK